MSEAWAILETPIPNLDTELMQLWVWMDDRLWAPDI